MMEIGRMKARIGLALMLAACMACGGMATLSMAGPSSCSYETQVCLDYMVEKMQGRGWLGIEYENSSGPDHMRLLRIVPGSPAEAAGFLVGDQLISLNGAKFTDNTEDECVTCSAVKEDWKPGGKVDYVVLRDDKELKLTATLATLPSDVMAMMIGMHMFEHANPLPAKTKP
jgi:predicted metalloprotease with PDZ domain